LYQNRLGHKNLYSDSGGLQATRRNIIIDDEFKNKIYETQAKYSDFAMTFDEMPLKLIEVNKTGDRVGALDRVYIKELIKPTAELSAKHIRNQNKVFEDLGSSTGILPILHGYSPLHKHKKGRNDNTYVEYAKYLFDGLEDFNNVNGLSIASLTAHADNRVGILKVLDFVPRILASNEINSKFLKHVHLLGLASPQRLLPIISLVKSGMIDSRVQKISFDSTAILKAYAYGRVYKSYDEFKKPNDSEFKNFKPELSTKSFEDPSAKNVKQFYQQVHKLFNDYEGYLFNEKDEFGLEGWESLAKHSQNDGSRSSPRELFKKAKERGSIEFEKKHLQQVRLSQMYNTFIYLDTLEKYILGDLSIQDIVYYNNDILSIYLDIENNIKDIESLQDVVEKHSSKLRVVTDHSTTTIKEYETMLEETTKIAHEGNQHSNQLFDVPPTPLRMIEKDKRKNKDECFNSQIQKTSILF